MTSFFSRRNNSRRVTGRYYLSAQKSIAYSWRGALEVDFDRASTLVIFLNHGTQSFPVIQSNSTFNILFIKDDSGIDGKGSWFYGQDGHDYVRQATRLFLKELMAAKIINLDNLYFSGFSMGGHAALAFGIEFNPKAIIAERPQTWLVGSSYHSGNQRPIFDSLYGNTIDSKHNDLVDLISTKKCSSEILISITPELPDIYLKEQIYRFADKSPQTKIYHREKLNYDELIQLVHQMYPSEIVTEKSKNESISPQKLVEPINLKIALWRNIVLKTQIDFSIDPFEDRSWRFWFQNLSWISGHLTSLNPKIQTLQAEAIVSNWLEFVYSNDSNTEFFWHDHSLAYRTTALSKIRHLLGKKILEQVELHIIEHAYLLCSPFEDNALSNHSFDQAVALFGLSKSFPTENSVYWEQIAIHRLNRELEYAFTQDGVHVENSPSYHHGMITNIHNTLNKIEVWDANSKLLNFRSLLVKAVPYFAWIRRPDGTAPPIGDSEEKVMSTSLAQSINPDAFEQAKTGMKVFSQSYAIWRSEVEQFHMTLKSCLHGRFHRHDDDCSITLWKDGLNVFLDSGFLFYQEKNPDRIHVRSAGGHTGFEVIGRRAIRDMFNKNAQNSRVEAVDAKTSTAYQGMYADISFSRTIEKIENNIVISDTIGEKNLSTKLCTNWIIPASWKIIRSKGIITFSHETGITWNMYYAEEDYNLIEEDKVFVSPLKNTKVPASRLKFFPNKTITTIRVELWK